MAVQQNERDLEVRRSVRDDEPVKHRRRTSTATKLGFKTTEFW
jgi:hypothetical protein